MIQYQTQIPKQIQLIDETFSNNIMLNVLAALENLAFYYGNKKGNKIFDYYSGDARNDAISLTNAVILQLEIFRNSHLNYVSSYSTYNFPKNLTKDQIIKYILELQKLVPLESKIYYSEIIHYLRGNSNVSGIENKIKEKMREWGPTKKEDLLRVSRASAYINTYMFDQINEVKNSYQKTGDYQINARLGEVKGSNYLQNQTHKSEEILNQQIQQIIQLDGEIEDCFKIIIQKLKDEKQIDVDCQKMENKINELKKIYDLIEIEKKKIQIKHEYLKSVYEDLQNLGKSDLHEKVIKLFKKIVDIYKSNGYK